MHDVIDMKHRLTSLICDVYMSVYLVLTI